MFKIYSGFLAGLSVGVYCLGLCLPIFLPILMSQKRTVKSSFKLVLEFSLGRLAGYLIFALIIGGLGQLVKSPLVHLVVALGNIWTGILMIFWGLGSLDKKFCPVKKFKTIKWPILLGLLTGVNVCPPFIASLTHVFNFQDVLQSVVYFLMFFLGTSSYIIPSALLGVFTKGSFVNKLAQVSGVLVGLYFVIWSLVKFW